MQDEQIDASTSAERPEKDATGAVDTAEPDLRQQLEQALARADENLKNWQRSAADFANFKRRADEEKRYVERWLIQDLLPVLDDFERAWASVPRELRNFSWIEGLWQINARFLSVLQRHGVALIETQGKKFSPAEHEAVMRDDAVDPSEQTVVELELQRGYRLHERVLRPALVKVGKPATEGSTSVPGAESEVPDAAS